MIHLDRQTDIFRMLHQWFGVDRRPDPMRLPIYPGDDPDRLAAVLEGLGYSVRIHGKKVSVRCGDSARAALASGNPAAGCLEVQIPQ